MINRFQQYITEQKNIGIKQYFYDLLDEYDSDKFKYHLFNLKDNHYCVTLYCHPYVKDKDILNVIDRINASNEFEVRYSNPIPQMSSHNRYYYIFDNELVKKYLPLVQNLRRDGVFFKDSNNKSLIINYDNRLVIHDDIESKFEHEFGDLLRLKAPFVSCLLREAFNISTSDMYTYVI